MPISTTPTQKFSNSIRTQIGDILRYATHDQVTKTVVPNTWSDYQVFEADFPILKATYHVNAPAEQPLNNILLKDEIPGTITHTETPSEDRIHYTWKIKNVPQYFAEPSMPTPYTVTQRLLSAPSNPGRPLPLLLNLCLPRMECTTPTMEAKARELAAGKSTQEIIASSHSFPKRFATWVSPPKKKLRATNPTTSPSRSKIATEFVATKPPSSPPCSVSLVSTLFPSSLWPAQKDDEFPNLFNHAVTAALNDTSDYVLIDF